MTKCIAKDSTPRTLYVCRNVLNAAEIIKWAKDQGFATTVPADDMHVTVCYSKTPVDWMKVPEDYAYDPDGEGKLTIKQGGPRIVEPLGDKGAVVLMFSSSQLAYRHEDLKRVAGATSDYDNYQPHVTITYKLGDLIIRDVTPYIGEIVLGPEIFEEIDPQGFLDDLVEKGDPDQPRDEDGKWSSGGGNSGRGGISGGSFVYHGTTEDVVQRIMSDGLKPVDRAYIDDSFYSGDRAEAVFVTSDEKEAHSWGAQAARNRELAQIRRGDQNVVQAEVVVLKLKVPADEVESFKQDTIAGGGAKYRNGNIPASWISGWAKASPGREELEFVEKIDTTVFYVPILFESKRSREKKAAADARPSALKIVKVDEDARVVYGWASVISEGGVPYVDNQGDIIAPGELVRATTEFMEDVRVAKAMHEGDSVGEVVHSFPLTADIAKSLGIELNREGWIVGIKVKSDTVWKRVKSGELGAFSIGAQAVRETV